MGKDKVEHKEMRTNMTTDGAWNILHISDDNDDSDDDDDDDND